VTATVQTISSSRFYADDSGLVYFTDYSGIKRNPDGSFYDDFGTIPQDAQVTPATISINQNSLYTLFQTDVSPVRQLLNIDFGINLAAIGTKLYLLQCGDILDGVDVEVEDSTVSDEESTTTTTTTEAKYISVSSPNGGESFEVGDTVGITWTSSLGVNEYVKIDLYLVDDLVTTINSQTSNSGSYEWIIPTTIDTGLQYRIKISRVITAEETEADYDFSDGEFSIYLIAPTTTTTTTTLAGVDLGIPDFKNCRAIPVLELPANEYVTKLFDDKTQGGILIGTSAGRILRWNEGAVNAYLTGSRRVYAEVKDGFGYESETAWTDLLYALYRRVAEVNEDKEIVRWHYEENPSVAESRRISSVFFSSALLVKEDLGFWKEILWEESKPDDTDIVICVRTGDTIEELKSAHWDHCFVSRDSDFGYGSTGVITRSLIDLNLRGKYMQFRVTMVTDAKNTSPVVAKVSVTYSTKHAVYFFTSKFSLKRGTNLQTGLLVADVTEPQNTEVTFGVSGENSNDWNDYSVIEPEKFFSLDSLKNLKIGIKMISYDDSYGEVAGFGIMTNGFDDNLLNG